jgi:hypothetical protein
MRRAVVMVVLLSATKANAEVRAGANAGVTLTSAFPTWFAGANASAETSLVDHLSVLVQARLQIYAHPEEEDFGSWGFQEDLSAGVRMHLFGDEGSHRVNPFVAGHAGLAVVQRVPFSEMDSSEVIGGYILGGAVGADWRTTGVISRVELAFDLPSFTTHDDSSGTAGELSLVLSARLPL